MTLIPFAINPFSRLGQILCHFLFGTRPTVPISFPQSQPHATEMLNVSLHLQAQWVFYNLLITIGPSTNLATFLAIHTLPPPHPSPPFKPLDSASLNLLRHISSMPPVASVIIPRHIFHIPIYKYQLLPTMITLDRTLT